LIPAAIGRTEKNGTRPSRTLLMNARLKEFFKNQPKSWLWIEAVLLSLLVGYGDYITGYEMSFVLFYSIPILFITWNMDRISGVFIALFCTLVWWWADEASGHPYASRWLQMWDGTICLGCFFFFVTVGAAVKARIALLEHSRQLEREIIRISEREQRRIGNDLHDGVCQYYAAVGCAAGSLKHTLEKQGSPVAKAAAEIEGLIMKGVEQARSLARGLAPVENEDRGLQYALASLANTTRRLLSIDCDLVCDLPVSVFDSVRANHLYRIAQEAINNAHRHGKATQVVLRLETDEGNFVRLAVEDNGVGLPVPTPVNGGMGLSIMQYRARIMGGECKITPRPGGGTIVACSFQQEPHSLQSHDDKNP
jgi:signal transduction histidine kinase